MIIKSISLLKKPFIVYDGNCFFCSRCVEFVKNRYPIPINSYPYQTFDETLFSSSYNFSKSVHVFLNNGIVLHSSKAVFFLLKNIYPILNPLFSLLRFRIVEWFFNYFYFFFATRRRHVSTLLKSIYSENNFYLVVFFFRCFSLTLFFVFLTLFFEFPLLFSDSGMLSLSQRISDLTFSLSKFNFFDLPTLFWFSTSHFFIRFLAGLGIILSLCVFFFILPSFSFLIICLLFLSFIVVAFPFYPYQWDTLLLEISFLAIFLFPFKFSRFSQHRFPPFSPMIFLFRLLLFRLFFFSGLSKLLSPDSSWRSLNALDYHFFTQPIPHFFSIFPSFLPSFCLSFVCLIVLFIELVVPFFIFGNKKFKLIAFFLFNFLMFGISMTGNYGFFNFLVFNLTLFLLPPGFVRLLFDFKSFSKTKIQNFIKPSFKFFLIHILIFVILFFSSIKLELSRFFSIEKPYISRIYLTNSYGLFSVMTKARYELIFQTSVDGIKWHTLDFYFKSDGSNDLSFKIPFYLPRLSWQLWFSSHKPFVDEKWLVNFVFRLLSKEVDHSHIFNNSGSLDDILYLRVLRKPFFFKKNTFFQGDFWEIGPASVYFPPVSLIE